MSEINLDSLCYDCSTHEVFEIDGSEAADERYESGYCANLTGTMRAILDHRIIDYSSNQAFDEPGLNFCDIGCYSDMPGEEEVAIVVSSIPKEYWDEFLKQYPDYKENEALKFIDTTKTTIVKESDGQTKLSGSLDSILGGMNEKHGTERSEPNKEQQDR